jgi:hypothetical protein
LVASEAELSSHIRIHDPAVQHISDMPQDRPPALRNLKQKETVVA